MKIKFNSRVNIYFFIWFLLLLLLMMMISFSIIKIFVVQWESKEKVKNQRVRSKKKKCLYLKIWRGDGLCLLIYLRNFLIFIIDCWEKNGREELIGCLPFHLTLNSIHLINYLHTVSYLYLKLLNYQVIILEILTNFSYSKHL